MMINGKLCDNFCVDTTVHCPQQPLLCIGELFKRKRIGHAHRVLLRGLFMA